EQTSTQVRAAPATQGAGYCGLDTARPRVRRIDGRIVPINRGAPVSGPNLSKEPGDGSAQPSNPYRPPAPDAGPSAPPAYESAPPQGAPYQNQSAPGGSAGDPYSTPASTNAMALGSLIASIAGWTIVPFVGWIGGVVLGHIARSQLR